MSLGLGTEAVRPALGSTGLSAEAALTTEAPSLQSQERSASELSCKDGERKTKELVGEKLSICPPRENFWNPCCVLGESYFLQEKKQKKTEPSDLLGQSSLCRV